VAVAVAGVIFIGHGQGQGQGHDDDDVYDHHSSLQLGGAAILERRFFVPPSATSLRLSRDYEGTVNLSGFACLVLVCAPNV
jgi:hypothetical protein